MMDIIDAIKQVHRKAHFDIVKQINEDKKEASKRRKKTTKVKHKWKNKKIRTGKGKL